MEEKEIKKLQELRKLFIKYAKIYDFDWHFLAALAYQESRLDQGIVSPAGAVGIMQILPETASYEAVAICRSL